MIQHIWSILAQKAVIDAETNTLSFIETIEGVILAADTDPDKVRAVINQCDLVSLWYRDDAEIPALGTAQINLYDSVGQVHKLASFDIDLIENRRARTRLHIENLTLNSLGTLWFQVRLQNSNGEDWQTVARLPLDVTIETPDK